MHLCARLHCVLVLADMCVLGVLVLVKWGHGCCVVRKRVSACSMAD